MTADMDWTDYEWEMGELLDYDPEERQASHVVYGFDENGKEYVGIGTYSCGELIEVDDIEIIEPQ